MNLKQAAHQLGVHYQTAYRWVRSGELAASKIGNRYEVSPAAVEQFVHRRNDLLSGSSAAIPTTTSVELGDPLDEIRLLAEGVRATAQPCFDAAVAFAGSFVGDAAVLRLVDDAGEQLVPIASYAAAPEDRTAIAGALDVVGGIPRHAAPWSEAERCGGVHVVHHMPRDVVRRLFGEEGRFAGRGIDVRAAAVASMFVDDEFVGGLLAMKGRSNAPFTDDQLSALDSAAVACASAHGRTIAFRRTWQSSSDLVDRLSRADAIDLGSSEGLADLLQPDRAQAVLSPSGDLIDATDRFRSAMSGLSEPHVLSQWTTLRLDDLIRGVVARVELAPLTDDLPAVIVAAVRSPDAELHLLAVELIGS